MAPVLAVFAALKDGRKLSLLLPCPLAPLLPVTADSLPSCEVRDPSMLESLSEADSCRGAGVLVALLVTLCMEPYWEAVRLPSFEKNEPRLLGGAGVGGDDLFGLSGILSRSSNARQRHGWEQEH